MIKVVAGVLKLDKPASNDQMRGVKKFEVHPQFNSRTLQNDIAILEVRSTVTRHYRFAIFCPFRYLTFS